MIIRGIKWWAAEVVSWVVVLGLAVVLIGFMAFIAWVFWTMLFG